MLRRNTNDMRKVAIEWDTREIGEGRDVGSLGCLSIGLKHIE
jgi:hypothetical protein